jgi:hypothetical protein
MLHLQTRIVFQPRLRCFYDTLERKRLKGAAKLLAKTFWPAYSFRRAPRTPVPSDGVRGVSARAGRARGTRVDHEVGLIVDGHALRSRHPFTAFALQALERAGIRPVASQVVVFQGRVATAVDVLGIASDGAYACIELKCSSDARYESPCGPMRGALAQRGDSLSEQHAVQCQVTRLLFEHTYGVRAHAVLLRVNDRGATVSTLPRASDAGRALSAILLI